MNKTTKWWYNLYNQHHTTGIQLLGVFLTVYGITTVPQFAGNRSLFYVVMWIIFAFALYEVAVKGTISIYDKK